MPYADPDAHREHVREHYQADPEPRRAQMRSRYQRMTPEQKAEYLRHNRERYQANKAVKVEQLPAVTRILDCRCCDLLADCRHLVVTRGLDPYCWPDEGRNSRYRIYVDKYGDLPAEPQPERATQLEFAAAD
jgi:hypothetical protein